MFYAKKARPVVCAKLMLQTTKEGYEAMYKLFPIVRPYNKEETALKGALLLKHLPGLAIYTAICEEGEEENQKAIVLDSYPPEIPALWAIRDIDANNYDVDELGSYLIGRECSKEAWVIKSKNFLEGAAGIFLSKEVRALAAENVGTPYYVIPSSVHEVIVVPVGEMPLPFLQDTLYEVNTTHVDEEDVLSYSVYMVDDDLRIYVAEEDDCYACLEGVQEGGDCT